MGAIQETTEGTNAKNKKWLKRRKNQLLPANFSTLTQTEQIEALRGVVIVQTRLIENLLGEV